MDEMPLSLVRQVSGLGFVVWYCSEPKVLKDRLPPLHVCRGPVPRVPWTTSYSSKF
jgi:hypothetical protein